ncbi:hypothetical protein [Ramlibacter sp. AN1133]|uniref:hypothetical protein n=1 Tax=Ramlibacter sp. AN1133 TaxID=3133429 RepID=UPI0030BB588F
MNTSFESIPHWIAASPAGALQEARCTRVKVACAAESLTREQGLAASAGWPGRRCARQHRRNALAGDTAWWSRVKGRRRISLSVESIYD